VSRLLEFWARWWRRVAIGAAVLLIALGPWWGREVARRLEFFRVRRVEIVGVRLLAPSEVLKRLGVDTTVSIWDDHDARARRVAEHPQVASVVISRKLPGTLVVAVEENPPVALVAEPKGLGAYDARGRRLPLDPSRLAVDLPVLMRRDTALFRLLADVREARPALFSRISELRRTGPRELILLVGSLPVRAMADVTVERLDDIIPVESDLVRRQARVAELDLRFRDQVIARLQ
jgi:cell division septal protein FtsQ